MTTARLALLDSLTLLATLSTLLVTFLAAGSSLTLVFVVEVGGPRSCAVARIRKTV